MFNRVRTNWLVLGCVVVLLLTVVTGVFQYRWINRLKDADRRQRRQVMERTLSNFSGDFRDTLLQVLPFFRLRPNEGNDAALEPFLIELSRGWHSNSDLPQLLASISIGTQSDQGLVFRRMHTGDNQFKTADWPNEFAVYRQVLEEQLRLPGGQRPSVSNGAAFAVFQGTPVLIFPMFQGRPVIFPLGAPPPPESRRLRGWCFLEFDNDDLRQNLLPELVARHYGTPARYQVAVVASNPLSMIYSSEPTLTIEALSQFDAGTVLLDTNLLQGGYGPPPPPPRSGGQPVVAGPQGLPLAEIGGNRGSTGDRAWLLAVKNKAGSIDELVEFSQRHTLGFSFIILVLSAGSSVMLILATVRARRLARQQMEFVAGVSHELRTPLTVIQSTSYNLSQGTIQDPGRVQQYGDVIQREARRLINQIERMLSFAGIQSGRRVYDPQPINVTEIAERSLAEYAAPFAEDGWQIEQHFAEDLPLVVTDGPALESALKNLFENALKYAARGKWLSVTASAAQPAQGKEVQITVADRGPGIAPRDLPHIFEPFYRGRSVSATISGAGLGLCLVERNLRALGGRVTVQSTPGQGTSFTLHLPVS
ncbi:MAG TPA: HAMP domain-containing sensor histidine kinase [Pyrinomonadaceae bacterium]|nr:HAMP domain-containing sensor histidine kinase [Pyrinomonadaceae bacterium]